MRHHRLLAAPASALPSRRPELPGLPGLRVRTGAPCPARTLSAQAPSEHLGGAHLRPPAAAAANEAAAAAASVRAATPTCRHIGGQVARGDDRVRRQAVDLGLVEQQEERAVAADAVGRVVRRRAAPRVTPASCSCSSRAAARSRSSSSGPNWIESVGHAFAQAGSCPRSSRS